MLAYNPYDPKWKMLTADNFRVHFDSFFDSVKFVIFADCISSMCCITFSPLHTNSYGVFLVHTISFRLGFYLPFYVPKWIVLKKILAVTSLYVEQKIISPAPLLFYIIEAQGRRVILTGKHALIC